VRLWDAETGEAVGFALEGHYDGVASTVFSPDGKKVASGSRDGTVRLWDAENGEAIGSVLEGYDNTATSIVFTPDGKVAMGFEDGTVRLWDAEKGEPIGSALEGHRDRETSIVSSPDGETVKSDNVHASDVEKGCSIDVHRNSDSDLKPVQSGQSTSMTHLSTKTPVSRYHLTMDDTGFLINGDGHQLIWIPAHLRGTEIAVYISTRTVVIGGPTGAVTIIRFLCDSLW